MGNYFSNDLYWNSRGDLAVGINGDIQDTIDSPLRSLVQEVRTRVQSEINDWPIYPKLGAGINDFIGEPNNEQTATELQSRLIYALTHDNLVLREDLVIDLVPMTVRALKIIVRINVAQTPGVNENKQWLIFGFLYDTSEQGLIYALGG